MRMPQPTNEDTMPMPNENYNPNRNDQAYAKENIKVIPPTFNEFHSRPAVSQPCVTAGQIRTFFNNH